MLLREISATLVAHHASEAIASSILDSFSARGRRLTAEKPRRLYKDILRIGFLDAFREHGLAPSRDEIERIALSPMTMGPHPEVRMPCGG